MTSALPLNRQESPFIGQVAALGIASSIAAAQNSLVDLRPYGDPKPTDVASSEANTERSLHRGFRRAVDTAYQDMTRLEADPGTRHKMVREIFEGELKDFFST